MHVPQVPPRPDPRHNIAEKQAAIIVVLFVAQDRVAAAPHQGFVGQQGNRGTHPQAGPQHGHCTPKPQNPKVAESFFRFINISDSKEL